VIIAPEITADARAVFAAKQNLRVLVVPLGRADAGQRLDYKRVGGGLLVQTADMARISRRHQGGHQARTDRQEMTDLLFAWRVAKYVKSNAIVYCKDGMTIGVGAGQMSRVDSARIAAIKAENAGLTVAGSVVASDAFFPFRDGLDVLAKAGATAVIQPGGSMRDAEVIAAADEHGIAMVFTGYRHFRIDLTTFPPSPFPRKGVTKVRCVHEATGHRLRRPRTRAGLEAGAVAARPEGLRRARQRRHGARERTGERLHHRHRRTGRLRRARADRYLTVVGPEAPLAAGVVDAFRAAA
jgi:hypothetical protein